jgi:very-short-patch-repair endonuclease
VGGGIRTLQHTCSIFDLTPVRFLIFGVSLHPLLEERGSRVPEFWSSNGGEVLTIKLCPKNTMITCIKGLLVNCINMEGLKFRRQHPIDKFIADFYCHEKKLVVELDGAVHDDKMNAQYDEARTYELKGSGIKVIRFRNSEVENNISFVLNEIRKVIIKIKP